MKFIEIILSNSKIKEAQLYAPAKKAFNNPDTGITIQNKSAYHVIKDCANITTMYLPHYVYSNYKDPYNELSGKFSRRDIEEFVSSTEKNMALKQLLICILGESKQTVENKSVTFSGEIETSNPYGEYGFVQEETVIETNINNNSDVVEHLCKLFNVK